MLYKDRNDNQILQLKEKTSNSHATADVMVYGRICEPPYFFTTNVFHIYLRIIIIMKVGKANIYFIPSHALLLCSVTKVRYLL
jgi:hypothetical protein